MTDRMYTPDVENPAWDAFVASLDVVQLEAERMRAPSMGERFGSREHHEVVHAHNGRRLEFRRQLSLAPVPYWFADWQLRAAVRAQGATVSRVSRSDGLNGSNSSTRSSGVAGAAESNESFNERRAA